VEADVDADAGIFKLVFKTVARDFHFLEAQYGFMIKPVVLCLDLAAVIDGFDAVRIG
jgi:hypothetical protein